MFIIDAMSREPVYSQLVDQVERYVLGGLLKAGDQMPSVRSLSMSLNVNPNTIQKAYNELDFKGITASVPGKGCFIRDDAYERICMEKRKQLSEFKALAAELKKAGITKEELYNAIDEACDKKEEILQ